MRASWLRWADPAWWRERAWDRAREEFDRDPVGHWRRRDPRA